MTRNIVLILVFIFSISEISAQKYYAADGNYNYEQEENKPSNDINTNFYFGINYSGAVPMSNDFKNFINSSSLYGASFDVHYLLNENYSLGGEVAYQSFSQKFENVLIVGGDGFEKSNQFRELMFIDFIVKGRYHINHSDRILTYIGIGVGASKILAEKHVSRYVYADDDTNLLLKPELGAMFRITNGLYLNANYSFNGIWGSFSSDTDLSYSKFTFGLILK